MSGTLPSTNFNAINFKSNQRTLFSETDSGKTFRRQIQGQRFSFTVSYPPMTRADFAPIMAFIVKQRSRKENFTITLPTTFDSQGNETGTLLVNGSHSVGDTTIAIDAFASDGAERLKAGALLKFAHDKLYMVVSDVTSSSNAATVTIEPALSTARADNSSVPYKSIPTSVHLTSDMQEFKTNANDRDGNLLFNFEFDVIESL